MSLIDKENVQVKATLGGQTNVFCLYKGKTRFGHKSISSGASYVILHSKIRWRKVKTMRVWLRKISLHSLQGLVKGSRMLCTCTKECNKFDLTAAQCFWLAYHNPSGPSPISQFQFMGGLAKEQITKLGYEK
jgi:hypothetical protein